MLTVNLFDSNFAHQSDCSVLGKKPKYMQWIRGQIEWDGITVFTDAYILNPIVDQVKSRYKVGWLHEPECLWPGNYTGALEVADKFDFMMTYHTDLLQHPKFKFAPYGGIWIPEDEYGHNQKTKLCSMLIGSKMSTAGHRLRHEIAPLVADKVDFFGVRGFPVDYSPQTKLIVLKNYAYSVVTETCRQDNLFTEWLLDCFVVGTIPIFWGCPNIGDFFNPDGILSFETSQEAAEIVNNLSWDKYATRSVAVDKAINDNARLAKEYAVTEDWMYHNIFSRLEL